MSHSPFPISRPLNLERAAAVSTLRLLAREAQLANPEAAAALLVLADAIERVEPPIATLSDRQRAA